MNSSVEAGAAISSTFWGGNLPPQCWPNLSVAANQPVLELRFVRSRSENGSTPVYWRNRKSQTNFPQFEMLECDSPPDRLQGFIRNFSPGRHGGSPSTATKRHC